MYLQYGQLWEDVYLIEISRKKKKMENQGKVYKVMIFFFLPVIEQISFLNLYFIAICKKKMFELK